MGGGLDRGIATLPPVPTCEELARDAAALGKQLGDATTAYKDLKEDIAIRTSKRFVAAGDTAASLGAKLRLLAEQQDARISDFEKRWITGPIPGAGSSD
jgi:hypothetical protein